MNIQVSSVLHLNEWSSVLTEMTIDKMAMLSMKTSSGLRRGRGSQRIPWQASQQHHGYREYKEIQVTCRSLPILQRQLSMAIVADGIAAYHGPRGISRECWEKWLMSDFDRRKKFTPTAWMLSLYTRKKYSLAHCRCFIPFHGADILLTCQISISMW